MGAAWIAKPNDVRRMFTSVLPHTGRDNTLPVLTCVQLEVGQDAITAAATDRYSMAASRFDLADWAEQSEESREPTTVLLFAADIRRLFTFIAPFKNDPATWELDADRLTVASAGGTAGIATQPYEGYPNWRSVMTSKAPTDEAQPGVRLFPCTPAFMGRFSESAKALGEGYGRMSMFFPSKRREPVMVRIGAGFAGILMPHNLSDEEQTLDMVSALGPAVSA